jgi:hypothetical protein
MSFELWRSFKRITRIVRKGFVPLPDWDHRKELAKIRTQTLGPKELAPVSPTPSDLEGTFPALKFGVSPLPVQ